jgi:hypothetical protein
MPVHSEKSPGRLGHHSPAFTLGTYVHLLPDDLPSVAFLDALVSAQPSPMEGVFGV